MHCFKPYYKWIVLNTENVAMKDKLNIESFKPYYKWIVLNNNKTPIMWVDSNKF